MKAKFNVVPVTETRPGLRVNWKNVITLLLALVLAYCTEKMLKSNWLTGDSWIGAGALLFIGLIALIGFSAWKRNTDKPMYAFVFFALGAIFATGITVFLMASSYDVIVHTLRGAFIMLLGFALIVINGTTTWWPNERGVRNFREFKKYKPLEPAETPAPKQGPSVTVVPTPGAPAPATVD